MANPLIAVPPSPASPPTSTVGGDGWWPSIDRNAARDALRLGEIVTDARLVAALEGAWLTVTSDLAEWQADLAAGLPAATPPLAGPASLAATTAGHLAAIKHAVPGPYRLTWNNADREWDHLGNPFRCVRPRYTPARAAWLTGTMIDSSSGLATPRLVVLFTRAVRFHAAAELVELYRDMGMTGKADARAEAMLATGSDYRRMASDAVHDILGLTRITSELI